MHPIGRSTAVCGVLPRLGSGQSLRSMVIASVHRPELSAASAGLRS